MKARLSFLNGFEKLCIKAGVFSAKYSGRVIKSPSATLEDIHFNRKSSYGCTRSPQKHFLSSPCGVLCVISGVSEGLNGL